MVLFIFCSNAKFFTWQAQLFQFKAHPLKVNHFTESVPSHKIQTFAHNTQIKYVTE